MTERGKRALLRLGRIALFTAASAALGVVTANIIAVVGAVVPEGLVPLVTAIATPLIAALDKYLRDGKTAAEGEPVE